MQRPRESNLELLRIIAIFAVLGDHYFSGTGIRQELSGHALLVANFLSSGGCIFVNVFVLIGTWFLVDLPFKGTRPLRLYLTLAFYSIPITLAMLLIGRPICFQQIVQGLFPFTFMATWFTNAYISLLLLTPFLQRILQMPKELLQKIVALLFLLVSLPASLPWMTTYDYISGMFWFSCVYLFVGYLKHHTRAFDFGATWLYAVVAILGYCLIAFFRASPCPQIATTADMYRASIKSIPNLAIAYSFFIVFLRLQMGCVTWINKSAQSVFSVYVIHQIPAFSDWLWELVRGFLQLVAGNSPSAIALNCLLSCMVIFILCILLDQFRIQIFDFWLMKSKFAKRGAVWLEMHLLV